jgi:hypothetical protein
MAIWRGILEEWKRGGRGRGNYWLGGGGKGYKKRMINRYYIGFRFIGFIRFIGVHYKK